MGGGPQPPRRALVSDPRLVRHHSRRRPAHLLLPLRRRHVDLCLRHRLPLGLPALGHSALRSALRLVPSRRRPPRRGRRHRARAAQPVHLLGVEGAAWAIWAICRMACSAFAAYMQDTCAPGSTPHRLAVRTRVVRCTVRRSLIEAGDGTAPRAMWPREAAPRRVAAACSCAATLSVSAFAAAFTAATRSASTFSVAACISSAARSAAALACRYATAAAVAAAFATATGRHSSLPSVSPRTCGVCSVSSW